MKEQTLKQLNHLFPNPTDIVWTGNKYTTNRTEDSEFFVINPMKSLAERTNDNVSEARNFLMEFDTGSYEEQFATISKLEAAGLPIATATFSGSKSIHLILSMAETLTYDYRQAWIALSTEVLEITGLNPDPSCKNEARLSRLAGVTRPDTGKEQTLLHVGGFLKNSKIAELVNKYGIKIQIKSAIAQPLNPDLDLFRFKIALKHHNEHRGLASVLRGAEVWAAPVNMYPKLLSLTMWAIDSTGVTREVFREYARENIYPHLLNVGYPAEKLDKAIDNAYDYKT